MFKDLQKISSNGSNSDNNNNNGVNENRHLRGEKRKTPNGREWKRQRWNAAVCPKPEQSRTFPYLIMDLATYVTKAYIFSVICAIAAAAAAAAAMHVIYQVTLHEPMCNMRLRLHTKHMLWHFSWNTNTHTHFSLSPSLSLFHSFLRYSLFTMYCAFGGFDGGDAQTSVNQDQNREKTLEK